jgi:tetratricopeptide (TPR) repeat protein
MHLPRTAAALVLLPAFVAAAQSVDANPASVALRLKGSQQIYNLDRDDAITTFREALAADPQDSAAYRGLATAMWLSITFRRGNMTVDDYLGRVTKPNAQMAPAPPETVAAFHEALNKAMTLAQTRVDRDQRDADAHYQLGAAAGLRASYAATVEGSFSGAFRSAREAFNEHEQVLSLDPKRKDAELIVGTYRYVVSTLALPVRLMAYVVGFSGDKERGLRMIQDAAAFDSENQADARFALVLLFNREKRYAEALQQLDVLRDQYPRNRLVWLEAGSTSLRAGKAADAERFLDEGMRRFADDHRQRMFGENALWSYKIGATRAALGKTSEATTDLKRSIGTEGREWVHGRAHLELGKLALKAGNRTLANEELQAAVKLCESDNDPWYAEEARRLSK